MASTLTESQFHIWRALFALVHADGIVTNEEIRFMVEALEDIPFTTEQREILTKDIAEAQPVELMYAHITDSSDQALFFEFARKLVWVDGDYGAEEQDIMLKLKAMHVKNTNIDDLVGKVDLEFEGGGQKPRFKSLRKTSGEEAARVDLADIMKSFKARFLND